MTLRDSEGIMSFDLEKAFGKINRDSIWQILHPALLEDMGETIYFGKSQGDK